MAADDRPFAQAVATQVDSRQHRARLKDSLVPRDTGIWLRVERGPDAGQSLTVSAGGVYVIGREGAEISLQDPKVSRKHAELGLYGPGALVVRDLASTNGTLLNGKRVGDRARLKDADLIQVGDTLIRVHIVERSIPLSD